MAAKKNTKMEKALQASRTSARNARAKSAEAVAKARKGASAAKAKARQIVQERPVIQVAAANLGGLATGYLASKMAKDRKIANDEDRAAGTEVSSFGETLENPGGIGMIMSAVGSGLALLVRPKNDMARKAIEGLGIGVAAGGMALKGADMFREGTPEGDEAPSFGSRWNGPSAQDQALGRVAAQIRAQLNTNALPAPAMSPAYMSAPQTISAWNGPARGGLHPNAI